MFLFKPVDIAQQIDRQHFHHQAFSPKATIKFCARVFLLFTAFSPSISVQNRATLGFSLTLNCHMYKNRGERKKDEGVVVVLELCLL